MSDAKIRTSLYCDRLDKEIAVKIDAAEYSTTLAQHRLQRRIGHWIHTQFNEYKGPLPDLVVLFRGRLVVLPVVNDKKDNVIYRALYRATLSLLFRLDENKNETKQGKSSSTSTSLASEGSHGEVRS